MVEAVRTGFIIARSQKAANAWATRKAMSGSGGSGLTGKGLEQAVAFVGMRIPGKVRTERRMN
jgi:hypothetical protein